MNTAEIKLDLFRKIDNLEDSELEMIYQSFLSILSRSGKYNLTSLEKKAVENALELSEKGEPYSEELVLKEARERYPQLKFK